MNICLVLLAILATCSAGPAINKVRYDNYKVFRIIPETLQQLELMKNDVAKWPMLDYWKLPSRIGQPIDIMVPPTLQQEFFSTVSNREITIETWIPNVQTMIDEETAEMVRAIMSSDGTFDYNTYHTYEEIEVWMNTFVEDHHPYVTKVSVANTIEGETVFGLKIDVTESSVGRNAAYIQGGVHAREWISPATVINMAKMFMEKYETDSTVAAMLDGFDWIIVPVLNVDGYKYSHTEDRLWRKNRSPTDSRLNCVGVDLNRNYDYEWRNSTAYCGQTYSGTAALSELETSGLKDYLSSTYGDKLKLFIDFHSYGQYWLYPWSYTAENVPHADKEDQHNLAEKVANAIKAVGNTMYTTGEAGKVLYEAAGTSEDFAYGKLGVKYSYVVELRDDGTYGFELPATFIEPTSQEIFAGMKTVGLQLVDEYSSMKLTG